MFAFDVAKMTHCHICGDPVIYLGPTALRNSKRLCSPVCVVLDDQITPGEWIDAGKRWPDDGHEDHGPTSLGFP